MHYYITPDYSFMSIFKKVTFAVNKCNKLLLTQHKLTCFQGLFLGFYIIFTIILLINIVIQFV